MTGCQRVLHGVKKRVDRQLYVAFGEVLKMFSQFVYEVRAVHEQIVTWEILDLVYGIAPMWALLTAGEIPRSGYGHIAGLSMPNWSIQRRHQH